MGILALVYLVSDVLKFQKWGAFFMVFGTNALFSYFLAGIWTQILLLIQIHSDTGKTTVYTWFYDKVCVEVAGNLNGSLMFAVIQMLLIWGVAVILYRKRIMIRL